MTAHGGASEARPPPKWSELRRFFLSWSLALSLFVCSFVNFLFFELQKWGLKTEDYLEYENDLNYEYKDDVKYEDDQDHKYKDDLKYEDNLKY